MFQPANFALNGAWFSGGIEWNIGATGHTTLSCSPVHAARVPAPDGGEMLRLWEWERLRDLPFQVDLWLPDGSDFLYVGARIRNPHEKQVPTYWWSNIAVPEDCRVLAPAEEAYHFGYEQRLSRVPVPAYDGVDRTYPPNSTYAADYFYEVPEERRRWIAALDGDGHGLVQTSTDTLRGRKLFVWGRGPGGRSWQQWLTEPGTDGYCEIQAGLARTQLEHVRLEPESEVSWLEAYGPLEARRDGDWGAVLDEAEAGLEGVLPRADVDAAYAAWLPYADTDPGERLAAGSGWGALEVLRAGWKLPGTPFDESTLGEEQEPWLHLLRAGSFPEPPGSRPPGGTLVARHWRDMLETAPATGLTEYHLGVAQWHGGDRAQAVRSWERGWPRTARPGPSCAVSPSPTGRSATRSAPPTATRWPSTTCAARPTRRRGVDRRRGRPRAGGDRGAARGGAHGGRPVGVGAAGPRHPGPRTLPADRGGPAARRGTERGGPRRVRRGLRGRRPA